MRVSDFDLVPVEQIARIVETEIARCQEHDARLISIDPAFAYETAEELIGICFVTAQVYLVSIWKWINIELDRRIGTSVTRHDLYSLHQAIPVINAVANYYKHHEEWDIDDRHSKQTKSILSLIGIDVSDPSCEFPCVAALERLTGAEWQPSRIISLLKEWTDASFRYSEAQQGAAANP